MSYKIYNQKRVICDRGGDDDIVVRLDDAILLFDINNECVGCHKMNNTTIASSRLRVHSGNAMCADCAHALRNDSFIRVIRLACVRVVVRLHESLVMC